MKDEVWKDERLVRTFLTGVRGGIPFAAAQIDVLLRVLEARGTAVRSFADLGCGSGVLAGAVLARFPRASATLVDFSGPMLERARTELRRWGSRVRLVTADLGRAKWVEAVAGRAPFDAVVSAFAIHHLSNRRKRQLYGEIFRLLKPGGLFVNTEHVSSATPWVEGICNRMVVDSLYRFHRRRGSPKSRARIAAEFVHRPDKAANILVPLEDQCRWLRQWGFEDVDCYFKAFEIAVFGGRRGKS